MRTIANVCFILCLGTAFVAIRSVTRALDQGTEGSELAGYVMGSLIVPAVLFLIGLKLRAKANAKAAEE